MLKRARGMWRVKCWPRTVWLWSVAVTRGGVWRNVPHRDDHFAVHFRDGECFGATTAAEYEARAVKFLCTRPAKGVMVCTRRTAAGCPGDMLRYDPVTREFGILMRNGRVLTYYEPFRKSQAHPRGHTAISNEEYFRQQCKRVCK